jgi:hypothetical protein
MVPPLNRFAAQQILNTLGNSHHWAIAVSAVIAGLVVFGLGAAVAGTSHSRAADIDAA